MSIKTTAAQAYGAMQAIESDESYEYYLEHINAPADIEPVSREYFADMAYARHEINNPGGF